MSMTIKETVGRYEGPPRTNNACFLAQKKRIEVRVYLEEKKKRFLCRPSFSVKHGNTALSFFVC